MEQLIMDLERELKYFDKIFLVAQSGPAEGCKPARQNVLTEFCASKALEDSGYKVLILSTEVPKGGSNYSYRRLSPREAGKLKELYFTYEFSDRFQLLSREDGFGGIFNFADTGILSMEEVFCALLSP